MLNLNKLNIGHMTDTEIRRLSWRCRRGLLELDIVLQRFAEHYLSSLSVEELSAFDGLLDCPDPELLDLITARVNLASIVHINAQFSNSVAMQQVLIKLRN